MTKGEGQGIQRDDAIGHHEEAESIFSLSLESISNPPNPSSRGHISDLSYLLCYSGVRPAPAAAKSLQSCPTLWDPIDSSPPGSPVPEILQARTLEWVAILENGRLSAVSVGELLTTTKNTPKRHIPWGLQN